jgi:hypothetical protein
MVCRQSWEIGAVVAATAGAKEESEQVVCSLAGVGDVGPSKGFLKEPARIGCREGQQILRLGNLLRCKLSRAAVRDGNMRSARPGPLSLATVPLFGRCAWCAA